MDYKDFSKKYVGTKEGSKRHHYIIDYYNKITPLPRNYKVKYTDSWCAVFVSFVLKKCNAKTPPYECSANLMRTKAIHNKQYRRSNPKVNDIIFYCWNDTGVAQHVGIISKVGSSVLTVIEGNKDDLVGIRKINKNCKTILGYATVPQNSNNKTTSKYTKVANEVIKGKYGNGEKRKKKLKSLGYDPDEVQKEVNKILSK